MNKRFFSLFLSAILLCTLLPSFTFPAAAASSGSCGDNLNWSFNSKTGVLTITGSGKMKLFTNDFAPWYDFRKSITSVSLPNGITSISTAAFLECTKLTKINLPDGITTISSEAFKSCESLTEIQLPAKLTVVSDSTFYGCSKLSKLLFPAGLTRINANAFSKCSSLKQLNFPATLECIEYFAFNGCSALNEVNFSEGISEISSGAFRACEALKSVKIPKSVTKIYAGAFGYRNATTADHNFVIYGYPETEAQTYANKNGFVFIDVTELVNPFVDVTKQDYFYDPVLWAFYHSPYQITKGTDTTLFSPNDTCTRAQVVTFLWRAAGQPNPSKTKSDFADVQDQNAYYYTAVLWAVEQGITNGTSDTTFSPDISCTRGQVVTFLWRADGTNKPNKTSSPFVDVKNEDDYFYTPVLWAVYRDPQITNGTDGTHFSPEDICTRGQVVTFLYRLYANS